MSRAMWDAKPRNGQRLALGLAGLAAVWLFGTLPPPVWWRSHWPRCTAMMRLRMSDARTVGPSDGTSRSSPSDCPTVRPSELRSISPLLQRMVIIGEDSRFRSHHGIDFTEIADALS